jgi:hypothetical protein
MRINQEELRKQEMFDENIFSGIENQFTHDLDLLLNDSMQVD